MELLNTRIASDNESTLGLLTVNGKKLSFVIEDEQRDVKVKGETRIPAGKYQVTFRKQLTLLTNKYRAKYTWFSYHLELVGVPNFSYVYIHIGTLRVAPMLVRLLEIKQGLMVIIILETLRVLIILGGCICWFVRLLRMVRVFGMRLWISCVL